MRIAYVVSYCQPDIGYMEYYLPKTLNDLGHDVCIFTSDRYYPIPNYDNSWGTIIGKRIVGKGKRVERGVTVHRLPCRFEYHSFCILNGLVPALYEFRPDIVQINSIFSNVSSWQVARAKKKLACGVVCDEHAADFNTDLRSHFLKRFYFETLFFPYVLPKVLKEIDVIVAIGEDERRFVCHYTGISPSEVPIIMLGVDSDLFHFSLNARMEIRRELRLGEDDFVILFSGKIRPGKRLPILFEGVSRLSCEFPQLKLLILGKGSGDYEKYLKDMARLKGIEERVRWVEFVQNQRMSQYFSAADVGCWPGDLTISVQEAMSVGLPVILSGDLSDSKTLLAYDNGLSVKQDNVDELVEALRIMIEKPEQRSAKGKRSRRLVEERLNWKAIAKEYLDLFDSILSRKGANRIAGV